MIIDFKKCKTRKMKKILIAIDYDGTAAKIAKAGQALATAMNAEVVLLHVISELPVYYSSYMFIPDFQIDVLEDLKISTQHFLDKTKKQMGDNHIETVLKEGDISDAILNTANEMGVDVIVMGTHGRKWLDSILMGSQVEAVMKKTTIPLLVIPTKIV